jgi:histidinol-phosphate aminotransferase
MNKPRALDKWIRPELAGFSGYSACKSADVISDKLGTSVASIVKLDANENPYGAAPGVDEALRQFGSYHIYPDAQQTELRTLLAGYSGADFEQIVAGSGSDQLIDLLLRLFAGVDDEVINLPPTFAMYKFYADLNRCRIVNVPRDADFAIGVRAIEKAITGKTKLIFLANPNNPTGTLTPQGDILNLLELGLPTVIDEAYFEFTGQTVADQLVRFPNLMVLRTFSKWAGLAGLRVGYGIFPEEIACCLHAIRDPYNVNAAAMVAVKASLQQLPYLMQNVRKIVAERDRLYAELKRFSWVLPYPSQANFILCRITGRQAAAVQQRLEKRGILTRHFGGALLENSIRFSIGKPAENDILLNALKEIGEALDGTA